MKILKLGTRGSDMALIQAQSVAAAIKAMHPQLEVMIIPTVTSGDKRQSKQLDKLQKVNDKKEWIAEIEDTILSGVVDFAVHSAKDIPGDIEPGTRVFPILERYSPLDVFISQNYFTNGKHQKLQDLPEGAMIGTSCLRRQSQVLRIRNDLKLIPSRGNVPTRIMKFREQKEVAGIIVASAGVQRLGLNHFISQTFSAEDMLPAANQGILAVQFAEDRKDIEKVLAPIIIKKTAYEWQAERVFIQAIGADCSSSLGVYAQVKGEKLTLKVRVLSRYGEQIIEQEKTSSTKDIDEMAKNLARELLDLGAAKLLHNK